MNHRLSMNGGRTVWNMLSHLFGAVGWRPASGWGRPNWRINLGRPTESRWNWRPNATLAARVWLPHESRQIERTCPLTGAINHSFASLPEPAGARGPTAEPQWLGYSKTSGMIGNESVSVVQVCRDGATTLLLDSHFALLVRPDLAAVLDKPPQPKDPRCVFTNRASSAHLLAPN